GYLARRHHQFSRLGRFLDPAADKVLTTASYLALATARSNSPSIPLWLAVAVVGRDLVILLGALALYLVRGYRDFKPTVAGKFNSFIGLGLILVFLAFHWTGALIFLLPICYLITFLTILISGFGYILQGWRVLRPTDSSH